MSHRFPDQLLAQITALHQEIAPEASNIHAEWKIPHGHPAISSLENLAAYLALRRHDLSDLQPALAAHGLSTLGRSEAHVLASLQALEASLSRIAGVAGPDYPHHATIQKGHHALQTAQSRFFGADVLGTSTRIMVTLPSEAATDQVLIHRLIKEGMTCARINCSHDTAETWRAMADLVRAEAKAQGRECRILMDIGGPKCRIETVHIAEHQRLQRGDRFVMVRTLAQALPTDDVIATINFPDILDQLEPGAEVWINDGKIGTRVVTAGGGRVELELHSARSKGERLRPEKGVNFPDTELHLDPLTEKDLADLAAVSEIADVIGFSFVQRPNDIVRLYAELHRRRPELTAWPLILKIETPLAVRNLPKLIVEGVLRGPLAVMIARGDLAVELGFARLSEIQEEIMWLCEAAQVPVVWATQVLETLVSEGMPTRAEATDAAMSQRAECVMLNKGPFLPEAVRFLADVLHRMDRHQSKKVARLGALHSW